MEKLAGNLVWVKAPYPAGAWNDIIFFNNALSHCLEPGKCIEADNGYMGHADKIKCPNNNCNPVENLGMQSAARSFHEMLNGHLKNWGILEKVYCHDIMVQCVVIAQLTITKGEPLFQVEYGDE